jgi:putative FmdB family regulatory protein
MPVYIFECFKCHEVIERVQAMDEDHIANCPKCGAPATRVYTTPQTRTDPGFYSDELGCFVSGRKEYEEKKAELRYKSGVGRFLGDNQTPKGQWAEEQAKEEAAQRQNASELDEKMGADYDAYYDSVETYRGTNRKD